MKTTTGYFITFAFVLASLCAAYPAFASGVPSLSTVPDIPNIAAIGRAPIGDDLAFYDLGGFFRFIGGFFRFGVTTAGNTSLAISSISSVSTLGTIPLYFDLTATTTWTTSVPADSQVAYGTTTSYTASSTLNSTLTTSHTIALNGLTANTTYHFIVLSRDAHGNLATSSDQTFTTPSTQLVFAAYRLDMGAYGDTVAGYEQDIEDAQAIGVDGFELDTMGWDPATCGSWGNFKTWAGYMFQAAQNLGTNFKLFFMDDMQGACGTQAEANAAAAAALSTYESSPNYFYYNGKPVFGGFNSSLSTSNGSADAIFWSGILSAIAPYNPFFWPTFGGGSASLSATTAYNNWATWFGAGTWLTPTNTQGLIGWNGLIAPEAVNNNAAISELTANQGLTSAANINAWNSQIRFYDLGQGSTVQYLEDYGGELLSTLWQNVINTLKPPMVVLNEWNDYTESYMGPASQAKLTANALSSWDITGDYLFSHAGFTQLNKYFIQWYKAGVQPTWPDAMYVFYRNAPTYVVPSLAASSPVPSWNQQEYAPTLNDLYITTILTAPASLVVTSGGNVSTTTVGSGLVHTRIPYAPLISLIGTGVQGYTSNVNSGSASGGSTVDIPAGSLVAALLSTASNDASITGMKDSAGNCSNVYSQAVQSTPTAGIQTTAIYYCITTIDLPIGSTWTVIAHVPFRRDGCG
jgi:glucan endo-1,3-alpha-glucosidase